MARRRAVVSQCKQPCSQTPPLCTDMQWRWQTAWQADAEAGQHLHRAILGSLLDQSFGRQHAARCKAPKPVALMRTSVCSLWMSAAASEADCVSASRLPTRFPDLSSLSSGVTCAGASQRLGPILDKSGGALPRPQVSLLRSSVACAVHHKIGATRPLPAQQRPEAHGAANLPCWWSCSWLTAAAATASSQEPDTAQTSPL